MILDTSFLLDLKDGQQAAMELHDGAAIQRIAMPTVMELHDGAAYTDSEEEYRRVRNLLLMYPILSIDEPTVRHAADLLAAADRQITSGGQPERSRSGDVPESKALVGQPEIGDFW